MSKAEGRQNNKNRIHSSEPNFTIELSNENDQHYSNPDGNQIEVDLCHPKVTEITW